MNETTKSESIAFKSGMLSVYASRIERELNSLKAIKEKSKETEDCIYILDGILDRINEHIDIAYTQLMDVMRYNTPLFFKEEQMETIDKVNAIFAGKGYRE